MRPVDLMTSTIEALIEAHAILRKHEMDANECVGMTYIEKIIYPAEDGIYTWYRIGNRRWIAGKDEWVEYQDIEQTDNQANEINEVPVKVNVDNLNIRSDASISAPIVGKAVNGKEYTASEIKEAYGYIWYYIGENQWIVSDEDWVSVIEN